MATAYEYGGMQPGEYFALVNFLKSSTFPEEMQGSKNSKDSFRRKAKNFSADKDGTKLYHASKDGGVRAVVKKGDVVNVIKSVHDSDHLGINATHGRVKSSFYWNRIYEDVKHYISVCEKCQKNSAFQREKAKLRPVAPCQRPFQMWGMDLTKLPKSQEGYQYLVVAVDYLTKYVEAAPLKSKDASGILAFFDGLCSRFGFPQVLITDQGREFCNQAIDDYCDQHGISHRTSSAYHPQVGE